MKCFVIMPFAEAFDPVFHAVSEAAMEAVGSSDFDCYWLKDVHAAGRITDDIVRGLDHSAFCIADVSGDNPNVMWETGYAMALGKPTILIGQDLSSLPFDLQTHRVLEYSPDTIQELKGKLAKAVRDTLARYELKTSTRTEPTPPGAEHRTISVTGSMRASKAAVARRIEYLLSPYLSDQTTWLVGSVGNVDLAAVRFLLDHGQRVTAVGYNAFDCAEEVRALINEGRLKFLDASAESMPKGLEGPTSRDVLFCAKSDLVVLLWDGQSTGTRQMVHFYQEQGVNTLLAFV